jgi:SpoVK/Ycf46/Vps4 family AAA+-type ATPase
LADGNQRTNGIIETLIRARYPIIYVVSWEEERVEEVLRSIAAARGKRFYTWTTTQGIASDTRVKDDATKDPTTALDYVMDFRGDAVFVLKDFHAFVGDKIVTRRLRDLSNALKTSNKTLVILSPVLRIPPELEKEVTVVDYPLPDVKELDSLLQGIIESLRDNSQIRTDLSPDEREPIVKAAQGLTAGEAENVFAKSLVEKRELDLEVIISEKEQIIRKSGMLEYYPATEAFGDVGGMDALKSWLGMRTMAFTERAREFGLPQPKGVMLMGVQGCGKSLCCKAIASLWRLPLLKLDTGKIFSGIVGSSEENVRRAISIAESVAPCILWVDEIEKGFAGTQSSAYSDAGTTARVFGSFITWLQEKTAPVFVVATANDISQIPPEFIRKGRFDEIFFVDLPSVEERREIFEIHLKKRKRNPDNYDLDALAAATTGFSGAEIEQVVIDALSTAFGGGRELAQDDLMLCAKSSVPLSMTVSEKIMALRRWAVHRCRMATTRLPEDAAADREDEIILHNRALPGGTDADGMH